jgi:hypothetical protein
MSTTATTVETAQVNPNLHGFGRMRVDGTDRHFGDFRDDLTRDGFAIVKGAIPREKALKYADEMYSWLEGL